MNSVNLPKSDPGKDPINQEPIPGLNPWLALVLLVLALLAHVIFWGELLGG